MNHGLTIKHRQSRIMAISIVVMAILTGFITPRTAVQAAARAVNGTVPEQRPLQPPPEFIEPNISKNIESTGPTEQDGEVLPVQESGDSPAEVPKAGLAQPEVPQPIVRSDPPQAGLPWGLALVIVIIAAVIAGLWYWHRGRAKISHGDQEF